MTHLMTQGLFHIVYTAAFFAMAASLWFQSQKTGNQIARTFAISFFIGGFEYICLTLAVLAFSNDTAMVKILVGFAATVFSVSAITLAIRVYSYIWPKFPAGPIMSALGLLIVFMLVFNAKNYTPKGISAMGLLDIAGPQWQIMTIGILMMLIFVPMCAGFIYKTFKKKLYLKGVLLGLGLIINVLFLPVSYQVTTYSGYVFFSSLASLGFALLVAGLVFHPLLSPQKR